MTAESTRLEEQLRRAMEGGAWHGPAVLELLEGVTAEEARLHPIDGAHSIWELVVHLSGTYRLVLRRLQGGAAQLTPEEDWPSLPEATDANWRETIAQLRALNDEARRAVTTFPAQRMDELLISESPYTAYVQFIGLTQHDLYHAGQIALLKRALAARPSPRAALTD